ncbi:MAG: hypothetical protein ACI4KL_02250 [Lentihominibacter sp.]
MVKIIVLVLIGLLLFKLAGGLSRIFSLALKVLGVLIIVGVIMALL